MDKIGIDIRDHRSKGIDPSFLNQADWIITLCVNADARCPATPPHIHREHWPMDDPAQSSGDTEERLALFRKTRDNLKDRIIHFLEISDNLTETNK